MTLVPPYPPELFRVARKVVVRQAGGNTRRFADLSGTRYGLRLSG